MMVSYDFLSAPPGKTWDAVAIYQRSDGTTPDNISYPTEENPDGNGVWVGPVLPEADFSDLVL
jgi:hypothetical protein